MDLDQVKADLRQIQEQIRDNLAKPRTQEDDKRLDILRDERNSLQEREKLIQEREKILQEREILNAELAQVSADIDKLDKEIRPLVRKSDKNQDEKDYLTYLKEERKDLKEKEKRLQADRAKLFEKRIYQEVIGISQNCSENVKITKNDNDEWKSKFEEAVAQIQQKEDELENIEEDDPKNVELSDEIDKKCHILFQEYVGSKESTKRLLDLKLISKYEKHLLDSSLYDGAQSFDGLPGPEYRIDRNQKVRRILGYAKMHKKYLIYSPPGSGKSALCTLLIRYSVIVKRKRVIFIENKVFKILTNHESKNFIHHLVERSQNKFKLLLDREPSPNKNERIGEIVGKVRELLEDINSVIITDDSQKIYSAEDFWTTILKNNHNIVISFSSFHLQSSLGDPATPAGFANQQSDPKEIESLLYSQEEFEELIEKHRLVKKSELLSKRVCDEIFRLTNGYPFLVCKTLTDIIPVYIKQKNIESNAEEQFFSDLFGLKCKNFLDEITHLGKKRCFKEIGILEKEVENRLLKLHKIHQINQQTSNQPPVNDILKEWLQMLIYHNGPVSTSWFDSDLKSNQLKTCYKVCLECLVRTCVVIKDDKKNQCYFFNQCFHYHYTQEYLNCWYSTKIKNDVLERDKQLLTSINIEEKAKFVKLLIEEFNPDILKNCQTRSKSNQTLLETSYDHFVFTSLMFLGFKSISPQYNHNIDGYIDFYINSLINVGLELLREGIKQTEHIDRFGIGGKYEKIQNFLMIDFHEDFNAAEKSLKNAYSYKSNCNYISVFIDKEKNYSEAKILYISPQNGLKKLDVNLNQIKNPI